ncbi:MAG: ABC transporter ATP-binding protein/permease [Mollicutes bacterium]|nr:ABC transporter ATP-binding protein/permease [Mollicutes bacterium]
MFNTLAKSIREYKKPTILTPIIVLFEVIMECAIPFIVSQLFEELNKKSDLKIIALYGIILVVMALLSLTCGALAGKFCANASCGFAKNLRKDMFRKIQTYSFENIDKFQTSSLVTRLTTDVTNVQFSFMMLIRTAIRSPFMLIFSFTMGFIMGGKTALIYVFVIPILLFGLIMIAKKAMPLFRKVFKKYDNLNNSIQENIKGMRVVKSFVREDFEKQKFDVAATDVCQDFTKAERILAWNHPIMQFCLNSVMIFILTAGSYFIVKSKATEVNYYQLSALLTYGFQILMSLMMLSMIYVMLTMSAESAVRICEVLNEKSTITNPVDPVMEVKNGSIDFEHVDFKYGNSKIILKNVNLHISSGETIGIIGGTGSAKTTLIQLISRLYDVTDGEVRVGGVNVKDYDLDVLRNQVSVVLQKNVLFSGTIKDNLRWGKNDATDEEMVHACKLAQADEFIINFPNGYDTYIEQGGSNVSGGQKQRLCIARALLKNPKIIIFDDSTSAVDTKTDALIRKGLSTYIPNTTKIIIAQRIASVEDADRIIVMNNGIIEGIGTHDELMSNNEIYREVYDSQNKVGDTNE